MDRTQRTTTETDGRAGARRVRKGLAGLALAAAVTGPVTMAADAPAGAAGCSEWYCGTSGNHNETAGRDPRNRRRAMGTVIAAASVALLAVLVGAEPVVARIAVNHNESVGVDGR